MRVHLGSPCFLSLLLLAAMPARADVTAYESDFSADESSNWDATDATVEVGGIVIDSGWGAFGSADLIAGGGLEVSDATVTADIFVHNGNGNSFGAIGVRAGAATEGVRVELQGRWTGARVRLLDGDDIIDELIVAGLRTQLATTTVTLEVVGDSAIATVHQAAGSGGGQSWNEVSAELSGSVVESLAPGSVRFSGRAYIAGARLSFLEVVEPTPVVCAILPGDGAGHGPELSYTDNGDGTFTDNNTGLTWEIKTTREFSGCVGDGADDLHAVGGRCGLFPDDPLGAWIDAVNAEAGTGFAGYSDWRVPNIKELMSLVDFGEQEPAVDPLLPGETASSVYWSSTFALNGGEIRWAVFFEFGYVVPEGDLSLDIYHVRAVRGGIGEVEGHCDSHASCVSEDPCFVGQCNPDTFLCEDVNVC